MCFHFYIRRQSVQAQISPHSPSVATNLYAHKSFIGLVFNCPKVLDIKFYCHISGIPYHVMFFLFNSSYSCRVIFPCKAKLPIKVYLLERQPFLTTSGAEPPGPGVAAKGHPGPSLMLTAAIFLSSILIAPHTGGPWGISLHLCPPFPSVGAFGCIL